MCAGQHIPQQWRKGQMTVHLKCTRGAVWSLLKMWLQVITSFPLIMISGSNKEEHFEYDEKGETDLIWSDSSVGRFFPFSVNITIKDSQSVAAFSSENQDCVWLMNFSRFCFRLSLFLHWDLNDKERGEFCVTLHTRTCRLNCSNLTHETWKH